MAVADFPLLGMRIRMIVSVLVDSSSPARSVASSSCESGLPCASVRLSRPTSRMSIAPSSPPPPSAADEMWLMPSSNERILLHATPVPMTTVAASTTAMILNRRDGHQPRLLAVEGADPVAASGVPDSAMWASNRDHRRRRPGRAVSDAGGRQTRPRCAGPDVGAVGHHRRRRCARPSSRPATWWSTARPTPTSTPPRATGSALTPSTRPGRATSRGPAPRPARG